MIFNTLILEIILGSLMTLGLSTILVAFLYNFPGLFSFFRSLAYGAVLVMLLGVLCQVLLWIRG